MPSTLGIRRGVFGKRWRLLLEPSVAVRVLPDPSAQLLELEIKRPLQPRWPVPDAKPRGSRQALDADAGQRISPSPLRSRYRVPEVEVDAELPGGQSALDDGFEHAERAATKRGLAQAGVVPVNHVAPAAAADVVVDLLGGAGDDGVGLVERGDEGFDVGRGEPVVVLGDHHDVALGCRDPGEQVVGEVGGSGRSGGMEVDLAGGAGCRDGAAVADYPFGRLDRLPGEPAFA